MSLLGKVKKWNDEKGFGFIYSEHLPKDIFFHISSFHSNIKRPYTGLEVTFTEGLDKNGRICASEVSVLGEKQSNFSEAIAFCICLLALLGITYLAFLDFFSVWIPCIYIGVSAITFIVYSLDKTGATEGKIRVPETLLHNLSIFGGWPGALYAQYSLRHKTQKSSFLLTFWITVFVNLAILLIIVSPEKIQALNLNKLFQQKAIKKTFIADVLGLPHKFNNRTVSLTGFIYDYKEKISKRNNRYTVFTLRDNSGAIVIHYMGHLHLNPKKKALVTGKFQTVKQVGGEEFYNQIEADFAKNI